MLKLRAELAHGTFCLFSEFLVPVCQQICFCLKTFPHKCLPSSEDCFLRLILVFLEQELRSIQTSPDEQPQPSEGTWVGAPASLLSSSRPGQAPAWGAAAILWQTEASRGASHPLCGREAASGLEPSLGPFQKY